MRFRYGTAFSTGSGGAGGVVGSGAGGLVGVGSGCGVTGGSLGLGTGGVVGLASIHRRAEVGRPFRGPQTSVCGTELGSEPAEALAAESAQEPAQAWDPASESPAAAWGWGWEESSGPEQGARSAEVPASGSAGGWKGADQGVRVQKSPTGMSGPMGLAFWVSWG